MKDKTIRNIRLCLFAALALCAAWILLMSMHFFQLLSDSENINWLVNGFWKAILMVMYIGSAAVTMFLCIKIVLNTFRGLRKNTVFPKNNVGLLFWLAFAFSSTCYVVLMSQFCLMRLSLDLYQMSSLFLSSLFSSPSCTKWPPMRWRKTTLLYECRIKN